MKFDLTDKFIEGVFMNIIENEKDFDIEEVLFETDSVIAQDKSI